VLLAAALLVLVFVLGVVFTVLRIKSDLEGGRDALSGLSVERLNGGLTDTVSRASDRLDHAHDRAEHSLFLKPLAVLPIVGDQIDALRDLTGAAATIGDVGRSSAKDLEDVLDRSGGDPTARLELLVTARKELDKVEAAVDGLDVGAHGHLIGPVKTARAQLVAKLDEVPSKFDEARGYLDALTTFLTGPSRYLVLAANNAEMRAGAGMPLQGGVLTVAGGDVSFGDFSQLANQRVPGTPDLLPPEWAKTWFNFIPGRSWVQTAVSPNFPVTAPIYAEMAAQTPAFGQVDGVIEVDSVALSALLDVIGPVELGGERYTAQNIEQKVLHDNYLQFDTVAERAGRQEQQGQIAKAIFDALKTRDVEIGDLATGLKAAAQGRHLLAWSRDAGMQKLWTDVGATGQLNSSSLMVAVQNIAGNKLDWFIDPKVTITAFPDTATKAWRVRVTVELTNPKDVDSNAYIDGTNPKYPNGIHRAMVTLFMPDSAYNYRPIDGKLSELGADPPVQMVAQRVLIPKGSTVRPGFEFYVPLDQVGAVLAPSGRVRPEQFEINGVKLDDRVSIPIFWLQPEPDEGSPGAPAVAAILALAGALAVLVGVRTRLRVLAARPLRAVPDLAQQAPRLGALLFGTAVAVLIAGWLISSAGP
jgi:hypothetical protein